MKDLEYQLELIKRLELTSEDNVKSAYRVLSARFRGMQSVLIEAQTLLQNAKVDALAQREEIDNLMRDNEHLHEIIADLIDGKASL